MTEDITRGLALLADEAEPATVNADEVITRARARIRNRRAIVATAVATTLVVGALVATLSNVGPPNDPTTLTTPPESLVDRLDRQLSEALPNVIPADWSLVTEVSANEPPLKFLCGITVIPASADQESFPNGCSAYAEYEDSVGEIQVTFNVDRLARNVDDPVCEEQYCTQWGSPVRQELPDGTTTRLSTYTEKVTSRDIQEMNGSRPDGTQIRVALIWPQGQRPKAPLTTDAILKLATAFTYRPEDVPKPEVPKTDPKKAARLNGELNDVLSAVIPAGWSRVLEDDPSDGPRFTFDCGEGTSGPGTGDGTTEDDPQTMMSCWAAGYYQDATGTIGFKFSVSPAQIFGGTCEEEAIKCIEKDLPDGTRTRMKNEFHEPIAEHSHSVSAFRPDGTVIWVEVFWTDQRSQTPLTDEQLLKFATAFTY